MWRIHRSIRLSFFFLVRESCSASAVSRLDWTGRGIVCIGECLYSPAWGVPLRWLIAVALLWLCCPSPPTAARRLAPHSPTTRIPLVRPPAPRTLTHSLDTQLQLASNTALTRSTTFEPIRSDPFTRRLTGQPVASQSAASSQPASRHGQHIHSKGRWMVDGRVGRLQIGSL